MGSKTKTTTNSTQNQTTANNYGWQTHPETADIAALREQAAQVHADPSIRYAYAKERERQANSYANPLGAYTTPAVRDAAKRSAGARLGMDERVATAASEIEAQERKFGQMSHIAALTDPRLVQTGGTSTGTMQGTQVQSYNPGIGSYIGMGASMAMPFL